MSGESSEQRQCRRIVYSITPSLSDIVLRAWGFDLRREYLKIIRAASLGTDSPVLDLATGSGRMAAILARTGHLVFTGDLHDDKLPEARTRIGREGAARVVFLRLDMELLPFPTGSVDSVVCLNTLHELERPTVALEEILRVHSGRGPLVLGDFNEKGFKTMQILHRLVYRDDHPGGNMPIHAARELLERRYLHLEEIETPLNTTMIARNRQASPPGVRSNPFG